MFFTLLIASMITIRFILSYFFTFLLFYLYYISTLNVSA